MGSAKDREEQDIVARRIARALRPLSVWVTAPDEPEIIRVANIQHLATPIRAQLTHPRSVVELAGLLHPTPAVGGEPHAVATPQIPAFEGLDRGWYAGPVGWTDANDDGEFCVALRCALLRGTRGAAVRGRRRRARLGPGRRADRDRGQARRAAAGPLRLGRRLAHELHRGAVHAAAVVLQLVVRDGQHLDARGGEPLGRCAGCRRTSAPAAARA